MSTGKNDFIQRADEYIALANKQLNSGLQRGDVSASFVYGAARFNAWMAASSFEIVQDMKDEKEQVMEYFMEKYRQSLEEHLNHHIENFK